jgi:hypothetical protein
MRELFEQVATDPTTMPAIRDDERDLCVVSASQAVEAACCDEARARPAATSASHS